MSRGVRIRLAAFLVLSAVGITYITASYLGFVDRILGRGVNVEATLPTSGGLFEGSEVTYRGVKIGKISKMTATKDGVTLGLSLKEGTELPLDSPMFVHNLSAVGEQYLDFEPPDDKGPYAENGDVLQGSAESLPVDEGDLLIELNAFVESVDKENLQIAIRELGAMFRDTGEPLQQLLDSGSTFVDEASAHTAETRALLDDAGTVLRTQEDQGDNIQTFASELAKLTKSLKESDPDLRTTLEQTPAAATEIDRLLLDLEPTLPILLGNATSISQIALSHLDGLEHLLVVFPRTIAGGFTGTDSEGYGHVNLQYAPDPPCTQGYLPSKEWRPASDLSDSKIFPATCTSGSPYVQRGPKYAPGADTPVPGRLYRGTYDPTTGVVDGAVDADGDAVRVGDQGNLSVLGGDSWKWLLVGPVAAAP
jgi:phospholipid/cholesterol/gamma-HCH transport system substrate-binding protein